MDAPEMIDLWIKQLREDHTADDAIAAATIEKLVAAGPEAIRRLLPRVRDWGSGAFARENLRAALAALSRADPETFIDAFPVDEPDGGGDLSAALARIDDARAEDVLTRLIGADDADPDRQYARLCVVRSLAATPGPRVQRALVGALDHPRTSLQRAAVQALGLVADGGAIGPLERFRDARAGGPHGLAEEAGRAIDKIRERIDSPEPSAASPSPAAGPEWGEIDRLIEGLTRDYERASRELEELGEPALRRLFAAVAGEVRIPTGRYFQDALIHRERTLGRLGKRYPETLLDLARATKRINLSLIQAMGFTGDPGLMAFAREALKHVGDD